jgi:Zn-dependent protease with chaperone function
VQLSIVIQLSIALLAGELAGRLPLDVWAGVLALLAAPGIVIVVGSWLSRRAMRAMDRMEQGAADRLYAFAERARWIATACILLAATSELPIVLDGAFGMPGVVGALFGTGIAASLAVSWILWPIERRARESSFMRALDAGTGIAPVPSRTAYVLAQARTGLLPLVVPLVVPLLLGELAAQMGARREGADPESWRLGGMIAGAALIFLLVPVIVPPMLGLRRLAPGALREDLESLATDARVGISEIWVWPTQGLVANAAVMGLFPRLRCVMLSDALLECMPREQVRAVMAHELGHVARRHLPWLVLVVLACWAAAAAVAEPLARAAFERLALQAADDEIERLAHWVALAREIAMIVAALAAFGWISRRFERQADTYAVQLLSARAGRTDASPEAVDAMVGALGSIAFLNHVPKERSSWRHGSIRWRQDYLRALAGRPHGALAIDRIVRALCWIALLVVVLSAFYPRSVG